VADIYLPPWIEDHLPYVTGPIFAGAVVLHARNILRSRGLSTALPKTPAGDAPRNDAEVFVVSGSVARFRSTTQSRCPAGLQRSAPRSGVVTLSYVGRLTP
jgi:hypothetical protein